MKYKSDSPEAYIDLLPKERQAPMQKLRQTIKDALPIGFEEVMSYNMIGFVVPHSIYPDGYHCNTELPLPFINIASQKNFIALYHNAMYADPILHDWFIKEYPKHVKTKLDMGKSCVRFKKPETIPYDLIQELCSKITPSEWISLYEKAIKKK
ncbi:DUF1801 domain-containing protein [Aquimarina intermedia]|uniref:Uncharacterized protein DUF1801 n=1 Tax=Aquimarina intermedia TaxID=350814 RepID=A0A5S5CCU6_9FLAO|nr:DUF1801 domain-containing protein [Aquimarina intermedia]TYP76156.1 uncharacterized protein DUF1801 [Aquimarina intermedia]